MPEFRKLNLNLTRLLVLWGAVVGTGMILLEVHANRPGDAGTQSDRWPEGSLIRRVNGRPILLMFLHPHCPCSRASVAELAQIVTRGAGRVSAHVLLLVPAHRPKYWGESAIEHDLAELPGAQTWHDREGGEAQRFGIATSGHVLLYNGQGRLTFSGGITPARGHQGDNFGRDAVFAQIMGQDGDRARNPVFGCQLATPSSSVIEERSR